MNVSTQRVAIIAMQLARESAFNGNVLYATAISEYGLGTSGSDRSIGLPSLGRYKIVIYSDNSDA